MEGFRVIEGGKGSNQGAQPESNLFDDFEREVNQIQGTAPGDTNAAGKPVDKPADKPAASPLPVDPPVPLIAANDRRWAWLEIDREAVRHNLKALRKRIGPGVKIMGVVKADAYGHGALEVAKVAITHGAEYLAVANVDEGIELRDAGITKPILVLAEPPQTTIPALLHYNLIPTVYNMEFALALGETADQQGRVSPFHLKIDTGMNRIGVHHSDAADFLRTVGFHRGLELQGVFTHFATADLHDTYELKLQLDRFNAAIENIRYFGIDPGIIHAANSAAAIRYKQTHYDMVRIGIAMFGLHPGDTTRELIDLRPVMSVRSRVNCIKNVPVGEGVSYAYSYHSPGNVRIATVPVGYGDGLSRSLSNRMDMLIKGRLCPQVGNICMDLSMIEINQRSSTLNPRLDVELGDEVIVIGRSGNQELTLDAMARKLGTISYELACIFGLRLNKVYKN
ncbi:MAG: alanine racemase [Coriobacteriales bacterium]|nr:alanine racemase [Coriobacteriales bacterium]